MRHELPDITISIGPNAQRSSSTIATVGGYVVVVATALRHHALTLTSCYLGQIDGDTAASHLLLAPDTQAVLDQRVLPGPQPGETHARGCLVDHAAELQAAIATITDEPVKIDIGLVALERAAGAWADHRAI